jgi:hypothetical protein
MMLFLFGGKALEFVEFVGFELQLRKEGRKKKKKKEKKED